MMKDYYPLILRAVESLDPNAPSQSRHALYERARVALLAQLERQASFLNRDFANSIFVIH